LIELYGRKRKIVFLSAAFFAIFLVVLAFFLIDSFSAKPKEVSTPIKQREHFSFVKDYVLDENLVLEFDGERFNTDFLLINANSPNIITVYNNDAFDHNFVVFYGVEEGKTSTVVVADEIIPAHDSKEISLFFGESGVVEFGLSIDEPMGIIASYKADEKVMDRSISNNKMDTYDFEVSAGEDFLLIVRNNDEVPHTFVSLSYHDDVNGVYGFGKLPYVFYEISPKTTFFAVVTAEDKQASDFFCLDCNELDRGKIIIK